MGTAIWSWIFTNIVMRIATKQADKAGVAVLSDENALRVRRYLVGRVILWIDKANATKWGAKIKTDDQLAWFWQIVMKSDTIGETMGEKSIRDARELLNEALAEFARISVIAHPYEFGAAAETMRRKIIAAGTILDEKNLKIQSKE